MRTPTSLTSHIRDVSFTHQLEETLSDADFKANPERWFQTPGTRRYENAMIGGGVYRNAYVHGEGLFAWVCNRSGGALARGSLTKWYSVGAAAATGGSTSTIEDTAAFVADEQVWNFVYILDDAGAAGAAPEGEGGMILINTVDALTIQTPRASGVFSTAVAVGDTYMIGSTCQVIASAIGDSRSEISGVTMAASLADNYWGWVCLRTGAEGYVFALVQAATAIAAGDSLIAHTGRLTISSGPSDHFLSVGSAPFDCGADIASDFIPVRLDAYSLLQESGA